MGEGFEEEHGYAAARRNCRRPDLAARVLRSSPATWGELCREVGVRAAESCQKGVGFMSGGMAVLGGDCSDIGRVTRPVAVRM